MSDLKLGQIITGPANRDAIHVAVAPVKAGWNLMPGQRVCLDGGMAVHEVRGNAIGIVDPFLQSMIKTGETFWLFLFPNTVTGLRHEWQHPAFEAESVNVKAESEKWLRNFCFEHEGLDYDDMLEQLQQKDGYTVQMGSESARDEGISEEFRYHFRIVTGSDVLGHFSCSC